MSLSSMESTMRPAADYNYNVVYNDEEARRERKKEKNRLAAEKCRQKKLAHIEKLRREASEERRRIEQMDRTLESLRMQHRNLEQEVQHHINNGCQLHNHFVSCGYRNQ